MSQQRPEPSGRPPQPPGQPPGHQSQGSRPQQPYRTQPGPPPPGYQPSGYPPVGAPLSRSDENLWALLAHLSIPFVGFVGPLVVHLVFKGRSQLPGMVEDAMRGDIQLAPFVTHTLPLERINEAFDLMHEGKSIRTVIHY